MPVRQRHSACISLHVCVCVSVCLSILLTNLHGDGAEIVCSKFYKIWRPQVLSMSTHSLLLCVCVSVGEYWKNRQAKYNNKNKFKGQVNNL